MTRTDILADLYRQLGYASSPAAAVTTMLTSYVNETIQGLLSAPGLGPRLLHGRLTFASVADQTEYALPPAISRVRMITDRTNDRALEMRSLDWWRSAEPDPTITGTPEVWVPLGYTSIAKQPSDASEIFVDSTSASDTNSATIEGYRTDGYYRTLTVTMTGTTAVSLGAAITDFVELTDFYISAAAVGTVTLHEDASGGTELARIPIGQTRSRYYKIALWPTPSAAVTYHVDYERADADLVGANDEPPFPPQFHRLVVKGALIKEYRRREDTARWQALAGEYAEDIKAFRYWVSSLPSERPITGKARRAFSRLGSQYPAIDF